jgi:hypothetical protein
MKNLYIGSIVNSIVLSMDQRKRFSDSRLLEITVSAFIVFIMLVLFAKVLFF